MGIYLGLDGGGTKTAACILDDSHRERGRGTGGPCNIATGTLDSLRESALAATSQALSAANLPQHTRFESVCAGVAGYTAKRRRAEFLQLLTETVPATRHRLEPDFIIAWWGATEGKPGIIVSAGTGAVAYGRNDAGETFRWDGRGFLLGDRGSGFDMARSALRSTLRVLTRGGELRPLDRTLMAAMGADDGDDVIEWVYRNFNPSKIAGLAEVIGRAANEGDLGAAMMAFGAGSELRISYQHVARRLNMAPSTPAYRIGGLWEIGYPLIHGFHRGLDQTNTQDRVDLLEPAHDSAYGAALLAMQADEDA